MLCSVRTAVGSMRFEGLLCLKDRPEGIEKQEGWGIQGSQEIICNPEVAVHPVMDTRTLGQCAPRFTSEWESGV